MAGDWIKMQASLPDKPEVWQIAGILGIDADSVVGKLLRVWGWFDTHTENGNAAGVTFALVDRITSVTGFAEAMALAGWLEHRGSELCIPNFSRHNGKTAKNRALTNERVAKSRAASNDESNAASVTKTVTREEKRREDKYPPTPFDEIVGLYHAKLPELPRVALKTAKRSKACREFWCWIFDTPRADGQPRASTADQALIWLANYFERAALNDWLTGKRPSKGHEGWRADFDFLLTERGRKHVIERTEVAA